MSLTGRTLAQYRVGDEISRGGMGVVYRATDTRLNREVALKVLPDDLLHDAERRRRFAQEAQAASAIEHPNIAVIYDVNEADGHTFIAMELVRGEKLSGWLARGRPPVARALDVAAEIASGLSSISEKLRQRGYDPLVVFDELQSDIEALRKRGILDTLLLLKKGKTEAGAAPAPAPAAKPTA